MAMTLTTLLEIFFKQKGDSCGNKQPCVLGKKPDGLAGSLEKKAHNRANQPGKHGTEPRANVFEAFPQSFASGFQSVSDRADDSPDCDSSGVKNSYQSNTVFFKVLCESSKDNLSPDLKNTNGKRY